MAAEGEVAEPRVPSPTQIRPIMGFNRMSAATYGKLRQVVDEDDQFRARVAEAADESVVGRAGWLWLTRPDGWQDDPAFKEASGPSGGRGRKAREQGALDAKLAQAREKADRADEARRRAQEQRAAATAELDRLASELAEARARAGDLESERNAAIRTQKGLEANLAQVRRDLKLARAATRQAEEELLAVKAGASQGSAKPSEKSASVTSRRGPGAAAPAPGPTPEPVQTAEPAAEPGPVIDGAAARAAVHAAAGAAADLARALEAAAAALDPAGTASPGDQAPPPAPTPAAHDAGQRRRERGDRRTGRRKRRAPALPPGVFDDSPEARRHLVSDPGVQVVVDGYNLAREAWTGLEPEEERRRTVAVLEEVAARSGAQVVVVFDGDDTAVAPAASRVVRVLFSATGVTADDHIASLLPTIPADQPVLVVSSDREVADGARANGAAVLSSAEFLAAVGR